MVLSTHTGGFGKPIIRLNEGYIRDAMRHYEDIGISFQGIIVGYLGSINNIYEVKEYLRVENNGPRIVMIDPIFGDHGNIYSNFDISYVKAMREILKYADIITPNLTEACFLAGVEYRDDMSIEEVKTVAEIVSEMGPKHIIITSVRDGDMIGAVLYDKATRNLQLSMSNICGKSYPGTGDIFISVLAGYMVNGFTVYESLKKAVDFTSSCIMYSSQFDYDTKEGVLLEKMLKNLI